MLIGHWTGELDAERAGRVLNGELPFDELTLVDAHGPARPGPESDPAPGADPAPGVDPAPGADPAPEAVPAAATTAG